MWPFSEFVAGALCATIGLTGLLLAIRLGPRVARIETAFAIVLQGLIFAGLFLDWGYSWVERTAWNIATQSNVWIAVPHALAAMSLLVLATWGFRTVPWVAFLAFIESMTLVPVVFFVELDTDTSFLSAVPLGSMYLSVLSAFLFLPQAIFTLPSRSSRWHRIAFGPRTSLMDAIESLEALGFRVEPPRNVLESGSATGSIGNLRIELDSTPSFVPPAYAFRIVFRGRPDPARQPPRPGFSELESFRTTSEALIYRARSSGSFRITSDSLIGFIRSVAAEPGGQSNR